VNEEKNGREREREGKSVKKKEQILMREREKYN